MKSITLFLLSLCLYVSIAFSQTSVLPFGVALCGAEFGADNLSGLYNKNYIYPQKFEIEYFANKGVALMQLPFRWERIQHDLYGPLDAEESYRMKYFFA